MKKVLSSFLTVYQFLHTTSHDSCQSWRIGMDFAAMETIKIRFFSMLNSGEKNIMCLIKQLYKNSLICFNDQKCHIKW